MGRTKIPVQTDLLIIQDLASGYSNKETAKRNGVSTSYVSKVKLGKKDLNIHVSNPTLVKDEFFEVYNEDLTDVLRYLNTKEVIINKRDILEYLEVQLKKAIIKAKMFQEILRRFKNDI